jgi:hypothetical protein
LGKGRPSMSPVIFAGLLVMVIVLVLGLLQTLGETRLTLIFPIISILAVLVFLSRCMFSGPTHH